LPLDSLPREPGRAARPKPEDHPYCHEQAGDLGVAQYSTSWTPGAVNSTRKRASKHKRIPAEALYSIDEYLEVRYGGVEVSGRFACSGLLLVPHVGGAGGLTRPQTTRMLRECNQTELVALAAWLRVECKASESKQTMVAAIIEEFDSSTGACCQY